MRLLSSTLLAALCFVQSALASTITPPVLPLIVRNPYLSTWLPARENPWSQWPIFYTGQEIGLGIMVSTGNTTYPLLGRPHDSLGQSGKGYNVSYPTFVGAKYDASTTNLTYLVPHPGRGDSAKITLSFLSPITPTSTVRQSIPASYLTAHVTASFDVALYIDMNGQWVSGNRGSRITWDLLENNKSLKTWTWKREHEQVFTEYNDRAEWGSLMFTAPQDVGHQCGTSAKLRRHFASKGYLSDEKDVKYRTIMDKEPVFAFAKTFELTNSSATSSKPASDSVLFTIAHVRDPLVQFASARGLTFMRPLWEFFASTAESLINFHYEDYPIAFEMARNYSDQLAADAYKSGSDTYVDIVALSARQVMGATDFSGTPENPLLFLKEISSNGNCQTVDVIFPAFPFFLYTNPQWLAYLLEPHLEHTLSGQYPNDYSMHDLGAHYPNLTGHADGRDEYMPVEECGDMLIMGLALVNSLNYDTDTEAQSIWSTLGEPHDRPDWDDLPTPFHLLGTRMAGDVPFVDQKWGGGARGKHQGQKWLSKSYPLWKQWTKYLVEYSLEPANQLSTDDFAGWLALQTNLALKGIIGINAMSELARVMDDSKAAKYYANVSTTYIQRWEELGISRDKTHAKLAYDWYGSWTTLYSLYADALLCFHPSSDDSVKRSSRHQIPLFSDRKDKKQKKNLIPASIYRMQSKWYHNVMQKYGLPLDSRHLYTKSDWEFEAAAVASPSVRKEILHRVAKWLNETATDRPFSDLYMTEGDGGFPGPYFFARPVVGGHFAFLTLERACGGKAMEGLEGLEM